MTMILPGRGNPVSYRFALVDPGDFGQEDAQVGDPNDAAVNESSEKPENQGGSGVPMVAGRKKVPEKTWREKVNGLPQTSEWDNAVNSAMENHYDRGITNEDDDEFWHGVHGEAAAAIDSKSDSLHIADMEQNDQSDPTDLEGSSDEDNSDGSAGGMGAAYAMMRWSDKSKMTDRLETGLERHENKLPINEQKVNNLIAIHRHAQMHNPEGLHESQYWYHGAHKYARELSQKHGVTTEHASGVLASLSPRAHWDHENKTAADYTLGKVGPNATKRGEALNISEAKKHEAFGFASKAYSKALATHQSKLAAHVADPKKNKHPGEAPQPPVPHEIGKKYADMGHQEAANALYNQAKHEDLRVPEDAPDARTKPKNKKDPGALRKVTLVTSTPNIAKAVRIARGHKPDQVLGGEKVRSFHNNIMDPDNEHGHGDVTVDTWHHDAAINKRQGEFPKPAEMQEDKEATHEAHRRLAANKEIDPKMPVSALQAQIWTHSRALDSAKNRQNRDGSRPLVEHEGGVPTGWKSGVFKPNKFKFGIHKQGAKDKDYWIDPKGGPDENPDLNPPKEESFGYDTEPVKKESMLRWKIAVTNVGEDLNQQQQAEADNAKARAVNTGYQSDADEAQDKYYFNYKPEKKSEPFGRSPDKIPTFMSPTLVGTSMKRWQEDLIVTAAPQRIIRRNEVEKYFSGDPNRDSRPVSAEEFKSLANEGKQKVDQMRKNSTPHNLYKHLTPARRKDLHEKAMQPWGGATINAHNGQEVPNGVNKWALTARQPHEEPVSIPHPATHKEFNKGLNTAISKFHKHLGVEGAHLGIFHDDAKGTIDFDPSHVVDNRRDVDTIGAHTHAVGGAYNFKDGNGYWPPHVDSTLSGNKKEAAEELLKDEPEAALPETDGVDKTSMLRWSINRFANWDSQHSGDAQDPMSATTPAFGDNTDTQDDAHEQMGLPGHDDKILSQQPLNEADGSDGNAVDPYKDLQTTVASRNWIMEDKNDSMKEIAENARRVLASKVFTPQEQYELINEDGGRPRNFDRLDIAETHYALLDDDDE